MFNLIRAHQYRTLRDYKTYIAILVGSAFYILSGMITLSDSSGNTTDAGHFFLTSGMGAMVVGNLLILLLTSLICGSDMLDNTINYEIMDGSKRSAVYFSRFIVALCWGLGTMLLLLVVPVAVFGITKGWGDIISVSGFAKRIIMLLFAYTKITALYTALNFIIGDSRAVLAIGFILSQTELVVDMFMQEITELPFWLRTLFSVPAAGVLLDIDNLGFDYIDANDITVVKDTLSASDNIICACICIVLSAVLLLAGLAVFKRKDMK